MADYENNILEAIRIITDAEIEKTKKFDQTIVCTIVDDTDAEKGIYKVSNGSATFIAHGNDTYIKNTSVLVTIPLGDYDQQKIIIGKYTTSENDIYNYVKPFGHFIDVTGNINFDNGSTVGIYANGNLLAQDGDILGGPAYMGHWSAIESQNGAYYQPMLGYETLGVHADFQTFLREYNCLSGDYGIRYYVYSYNPEEESIGYLRTLFNAQYNYMLNSADHELSNREKQNLRLNTLNNIIAGSIQNETAKRISCSIFEFNTTDMNGDIYDFDIGYEQEAIFDVSNLGSIIHIESELYQDNNFTYRDINIDDNLTTNDIDESIQSISYLDPVLNGIILPGENIIVKDAYFCLGYNKETFTEDKLILYTENDLLYSKKDTNENNTKDLRLKWIHIKPDKTIEIYDNSFDFVENSITMDDIHYKLEWYRYQLSAPTLHNYSGLGWVNITDLASFEENDIPPNIFRYSNFVPNVELNQERIKVCLIPGDIDINNHFIARTNEVLTSNILTFTNKENVISSNGQLLFSQEDFYLVNNDVSDHFAYFLYKNDNYISQSVQTDENNQKIINKPEDRKRQINCYYKGSLLSAATGVNVSYIKWTYPDGYTMIVPCQSDGTKLESNVLEEGLNSISDQNISIDNSFLSCYYKISNYYHNTYTNNTITCEVIIDRVRYKASVSMRFGHQNTNGSDFTLVPYFDNKYTIGESTTINHVPNGLPIVSDPHGSKVRVKLEVRNQNYDLVDWNNKSVLGGANVIWSEYYHTPYDTNEYKIKYVPIKGESIPNNRITPDNSIINTDCKYCNPTFIQSNSDDFNENKQYYFPTYTLVTITEKDYAPNIFFIKNNNTVTKYIPAPKTQIPYGNVVYWGNRLVNIDSVSYESNKYYYQDEDTYFLSTDIDYVENRDYYEFYQIDVQHGNYNPLFQYYFAATYQQTWLGPIPDINFDEEKEYYIKHYEPVDIKSNEYTAGKYYITNENINELGIYNPYQIYYTTSIVQKNIIKTNISINPQVDGNEPVCDIIFTPNNINLRDCMKELLVLQVVIKDLVSYDLIAYFPIPLNYNDNVDAYLGPDYIRYESDGYIETYRDPITIALKNLQISNDKPALFIPKKEFLHNDTWDSYLDGRNYGQINNKKIYNPPSVYINNSEPLSCGIMVQQGEYNDIYNSHLNYKYEKVTTPVNDTDFINAYENDEIYVYAPWNLGNNNYNPSVTDLNGGIKFIKAVHSSGLSKTLNYIPSFIINSNGISNNDMYLYTDNENINIFVDKPYYLRNIDNVHFTFFNPVYNCIIDNNNIEHYYIYLKETTQSSPRENERNPRYIRIDLNTKEVCINNNNEITYQSGFTFNNFNKNYYIYPFDIVNAKKYVDINFDITTYNELREFFPSSDDYYIIDEPFFYKKVEIDYLPIYWTQPLVFYQNAYPNGTVNKWDGETFTIDENAGTILSHAIVAGKKNTDNTFSGVMLGALEYFDHVENNLTEQTGVWGFHHGSQSYAFKEDGTAFIGKTGHGRIHFDGNKGTICSETWNEETQEGMCIDLDDGWIHMRYPSSTVSHSITKTYNTAKEYDTAIGNFWDYLEKYLKNNTIEITGGKNNDNALTLKDNNNNDIVWDLSEETFTTILKQKIIEKLSTLQPVPFYFKDNSNNKNIFIDDLSQNNNRILNVNLQVNVKYNDNNDPQLESIPSGLLQFYYKEYDDSSTIYTYTYTETLNYNRFIDIDVSETQYPLSIGEGNSYGGRKFYVEWDGTLHASDGYFTGNIDASSGTIGGWTITKNYLRNKNGSIKLNTNDGIILTNLDEDGILLDNSVINIQSGNETGKIGAITSSIDLDDNGIYDDGIYVGLDSNYTQLTLIGGDNPHSDLRCDNTSITIYENYINITTPNGYLSEIKINNTSLEYLITSMVEDIVEDMMPEPEPENNSGE